MAIDYGYITQSALLPGLILAFFGWVFGTADVLTLEHVNGLNKYTLKWGIPINIFTTIIRSDSDTYVNFVYLYLDHHSLLEIFFLSFLLSFTKL